MFLLYKRRRLLLTEQLENDILSSDQNLADAKGGVIKAQKELDKASHELTTLEASAIDIKSAKTTPLFDTILGYVSRTRACFTDGTSSVNPV